jgi:hypothetical protein
VVGMAPPPAAGARRGDQQSRFRQRDARPRCAQAITRRNYCPCHRAPHCDGAVGQSDLCNRGRQGRRIRRLRFFVGAPRRTLPHDARSSGPRVLNAHWESIPAVKVLPNLRDGEETADSLGQLGGPVSRTRCLLGPYPHSQGEGVIPPNEFFGAERRFPLPAVLCQRPKRDVSPREKPFTPRKIFHSRQIHWLMLILLDSTFHKSHYLIAFDFSKSSVWAATLLIVQS